MAGHPKVSSLSWASGPLGSESPMSLNSDSGIDLVFRALGLGFRVDDCDKPEYYKRP